MRYILLCLSILIISCTPKWNKEHLIGSWQSISWTEVVSGKAIAQPMRLSFSEQYDYTLDDGSSEGERGRYSLEGDYLQLLADGQSPYTLKFNTLTPDTLILDMNRAGSLEQIVFIKQLE